MPKVLISANAAWNIAHFRSALVKALIADGHEIVAAVGADTSCAALEAMGVRVQPLPMASQGISILEDVRLFLRYLALMRRERPAVFLGWTIKPNVYGSLAAAITGVPAINNISGLGTAFIRQGWLGWIASRLYRLGLRRSVGGFFQNTDDRDLFLARKLVRPSQVGLLPGSGIDASLFDARRYPVSDDGLFRFLLVARLIRDKGIVEYVDAARMLAARYPGVRFQIMGFLDVRNRTAIPRETVEAWMREGCIEYLGAADDVRPAVARADCIVLPSYREGRSRVLIEAAAMERPAIASDVPGCRDVVQHGRTGLLCRPRDAHDLAEKMRAMLELKRDDRVMMGVNARKDAIRRFPETEIVDRYRSVISRSLSL